jgi:hypothetical protein
LDALTMEEMPAPMIPLENLPPLPIPEGMEMPPPPLPAIEQGGEVNE